VCRGRPLAPRRSRTPGSLPARRLHRTPPPLKITPQTDKTAAPFPLPRPTLPCISPPSPPPAYEVVLAPSGLPARDELALLSTLGYRNAAAFALMAAAALQPLLAAPLFVPAMRSANKARARARALSRAPAPGAGLGAWEAAGPLWPAGTGAACGCRALAGRRAPSPASRRRAWGRPAAPRRPARARPRGHAPMQPRSMHTPAQVPAWPFLLAAPFLGACPLLAYLALHKAPRRERRLPLPAAEMQARGGSARGEQLAAGGWGSGVGSG
jgi:hypothetical protein